MLQKVFNIFKAHNQKKRVVFLGIFGFILISNFFLTVIPAFAQGMEMGESPVVDTKNMSPLMRLIEVDNDNYTPIDVALDAICLLLMIIASGFIIKSIREYGKSTIGVALLYFFIATIVLGAIKIIFVLDDNSVGSYANVKDVTEMVAWHTLFTLAIFLFYLAGKTLTKLVSSDKGKSSYTNANILLIFSVVLSICIIVSMPIPMVQNFLVSNLQNTWFETFGMFHIIALLMAGGIAIYLLRVKNRFKGYSGVIGNLSISLTLLATVHAWELLNESWHVIIVSGDFGEFIERVLWVPVFIFILTAFIKLQKMATVTPSPVPVTPNAEIANPQAQTPSTVQQPVTLVVTPTSSENPSQVISEKPENTIA